MKHRLFLGVLVAVASTTAAPAAFARPVPCQLVVDAAGDANENPAVGGDGLPRPGVSAPAADVRTADLGSNGSVLSALVRLEGSPAPDVMSPAGYTYEVRFVIDGERLALFASAHVDGDSFSAGSANDFVNLPEAIDAPPVRGTFDRLRNRIFIHAPWQVLDQLAHRKLRPGTATEVEVYTYRHVGTVATGATTVLADEAEAVRDYPLGTTTCVRPGIG